MRGSSRSQGSELAGSGGLDGDYEMVRRTIMVKPHAFAETGASQEMDAAVYKFALITYGVTFEHSTDLKKAEEYGVLSFVSAMIYASYYMRVDLEFTTDVARNLSGKMDLISAFFKRSKRVDMRDDEFAALMEGSEHSCEMFAVLAGMSIMLNDSVPTGELARDVDDVEENAYDSIAVGMAMAYGAEERMNGRVRDRKKKEEEVPEADVTDVMASTVEQDVVTEDDEEPASACSTTEECEGTTNVGAGEAQVVEVNGVAGATIAASSTTDEMKSGATSNGPEITMKPGGVENEYDKKDGDPILHPEGVSWRKAASEDWTGDEPGGTRPFAKNRNNYRRKKREKASFKYEWNGGSWMMYPRGEHGGYKAAKLGYVRKGNRKWKTWTQLDPGETAQVTVQ